MERPKMQPALGATIELARELKAITPQFLHERGYSDLISYAERELRIDKRTVKRCLDVLRVTEELEEIGVSLPSNESQVLQLTRLPEEQVVPLWKKLVEDCKKKDVLVTVSRIRAAVNFSEAAKPPAKPGVRVQLDCDLP